MTDDVRTEIASALSRLIPENEHFQAVQRLAVVGIGGVLYRHHRKGDGLGWSELLAAEEHRLRHVVDWLVSAVAANDPWLARTDTRDRPLKLLKMHSVDQLFAEAEKAFVKKLQNISTAPSLADDERLEMELDDGYRIVRMLSPQALDRESSEMQHCVGLGSYDRHLSSGYLALYSLRDRFNKPHATLEIDTERATLLQLRGKQNAMPVARYLHLLAPFIAEQKLDGREMERVGFVIDVDDIVHHVTSIPDGTTFGQSVRLSPPDGDDADIRVPIGMTVHGDLEVDGLFHAVLSKAGVVNGNVIGRNFIVAETTISPEFRFNGGLDLEGCLITGFPENLHVRGNLILKGTTLCQKLSSGLVVEGDLDITDSNIAELPDDIVVKGSLKATNSNLVALPQGLSVGGGMFLGGSKSLREIPAMVSVGGNLMLRGSSVLSISDDVRIGGMVSLDADKAADFAISDTAKIADGFYFRPTPGVADFLGVNIMPASEFRNAVNMRDSGMSATR